MSLSSLGVSALSSLPVVRVEWEIGSELGACPAVLRVCPLTQPWLLALPGLAHSHRMCPLQVSTSPLDLIACPVLLKRLETFFSHPTTQPTHHELVCGLPYLH